MLKNQNSWFGFVGALSVVALIVLFVAGDSKALEEGMTKANHYKCYPILDWAEFEPVRVELKDQFGNSVANVVRPYKLCNPVDKNGEGIVDMGNHLVCYKINDDPSGAFERVKEVVVQNQFGKTTLWAGVPGRELCLPSQKQLVE